MIPVIHERGKMDIEKIKQLINLVEDSGISELEIKEGEGSVRISRALPNLPSMHPMALTAPPMGVHIPTHAPTVHLPAQTTAPLKPAGQTITAPMVGTFYKAASPTARPFVQLGQTLKKGDVVCIIEAMKMLNQIESEISGTVTAILVENGQPVEFGQPLFSVEPS